MNSRLELQKKLCDILGSKNVYFQPPESVKMQYPAIVYSLSGIKELHANDSSYLRRRRYTLTLIDKNPDSPYLDEILAFPRARFDRSFSSNNLTHFVFELYY